LYRLDGACSSTVPSYSKTLMLRVVRLLGDAPGAILACRSRPQHEKTRI
jgi:hypothetical protein